MCRKALGGARSASLPAPAFRYFDRRQGGADHQADPHTNASATGPAPRRAVRRADRSSELNIEKYTERARGFIQNAQQLALGRGHQQFSPLHLLKVLLDDEEGMTAGLITKAGGDARMARSETEAATNRIPRVSGDASQLYYEPRTGAHLRYL